MSALAGWLGVDAFAWGWMLLALPLPLLVHAMVPARGGLRTGLRVPWDERLHRIAAAGQVASTPRGLPWLLLLAWCLLCVAAARPQQLGPPGAAPPARRAREGGGGPWGARWGGGGGGPPKGAPRPRPARPGAT